MENEASFYVDSSTYTSFVFMLQIGPYEALIMGNEASFYVDSSAPSHAFCPCGHVCSEKTTK